MTITFFVEGKPMQQGSVKPFLCGKKINVTHSNAENLKPWRLAVGYCAREAGVKVADGEVAIDVDFIFLRPASHYRTGKHSKLLKPSAPAFFKIQTPDLDKLARGILDALTMIAYFDDRQVCELRVRKYWSRNKQGAMITIREPFARE